MLREWVHNVLWFHSALCTAQGALSPTWINIKPSWVLRYMPSKLCDKDYLCLLKFHRPHCWNSERITYFIPHFIWDVVTYVIWGLNLVNVYWKRYQLPAAHYGMNHWSRITVSIPSSHAVVRPHLDRFFSKTGMLYWCVYQSVICGDILRKTH